jgi:hypothetical protein
MAVTGPVTDCVVAVNVALLAPPGTTMFEGTTTLD